MNKYKENMCLVRRHFITLIVSVFCIETYAQVDLYDLSLEELLQIEVKGVSKAVESLKETPMSVFVMSRNEMIRNGNRSLFEMLDYAPGFSFYNTDYYGQFGVVGRGMTSVWRYAMGFEFLEIEDFGHFVLSPHFFKNVEIVKGPAGLMWGGGAEAGLINFNIRDDIEGIEAHAEAGNFNRQSYDLLYGNKFNDNGDGLFVGFHIEKQDFEEVENSLLVFPKDFLPKIRVNGLNPSWSVLAKYQNKGFKFVSFKDHNDHIVPHMWRWNNPDQMDLIETVEEKNGHFHDEFETTAMRGEYHVIQNNENIEIYAYGTYYQRRWFINGIGSLTQRKSLVGFGSKFNLYNNKLNIDFGGDMYVRNESNSPNNNSYIATQNGFQWWNEAYFPVLTETRNVYLQTGYKIVENLKVILGGRIDFMYDAPGGDDIIFSGPRLGAIYSPIEELTLKYLYNKTDRRPAGNEISEGGLTAKPENLNVHEFVAIYAIDKININLSVFQQKLDDRIFKNAGSNHVNWYNGGGVKCFGVEIAFKYKVVDNVELYLNGHYHNIEAVEQVIDNQVFSVPKLEDGRIPFAPDIGLIIGSEVNIKDVIRINLAVRHFNAIPYFDTGGNEAEVNATFVNLSLRTKHFFNNHASFRINTLNLFNNQTPVPAFGEHISNLNGTISPEGLRIFGGIEFVF